jgi:hypothetical protein
MDRILGEEWGGVILLYMENPLLHVDRQTNALTSQCLMIYEHVSLQTFNMSSCGLVYVSSSGVDKKHTEGMLLR